MGMSLHITRLKQDGSCTEVRVNVDSLHTEAGGPLPAVSFLSSAVRAKKNS